MSKFAKLYIILTLALSLLTGSTALAQGRYRSARRQVSSSEAAIKSYSDSLANYRKAVDSLRTANDSLQNANGTLYRLFAPTTYYNDIADNAFRLNGDTTNVINNTLMDVYLRHPEYVKYSSKKLSSQASPVANSGIDTPSKITTLTPVPVSDVGTADLGNDVIDFYVTKPNFWTFSGDYYLQFMQNYVSENWYKSGSNNYSMLASVTLQYNYNNKQKIKWDNKLEMKLGFLTTEADTVNQFKTSEDLLRYTSKLGLQASKRWYYTFQLIANTQFTRGMKNNDKKIYSDFFSPFNLNLSIGMDYTVATNNQRLTGTVHLAPLAYNFKYVGRGDLATSFGLEKGRHSLNDWGSQFTVELLWKPIDMISWQARIYAYTTYHKIEMEWENTLTFQFNRYISAKLFLYPRFDDSVKRVDDMSLIQFKEYLSVGFGYSM